MTSNHHINSDWQFRCAPLPAGHAKYLPYNDMICLFCKKNGPYNTIEHIVPESLGNKRLLLHEQVCDSCQAYLGKEVEHYVLKRSPIGAWRVLAGIETKNGKNPTFSFRQPNRDKGRLPDRHFANDDSIALNISEEGKHEFEIHDEEILKAVADGSKTNFKLVLTPKMLHMMGRFLGKVGLEILARDYPDFARSERFDIMRRFVRFGEPVSFLWPIFYGLKGGPPAIGRYGDAVNILSFSFKGRLTFCRKHHG